MINQTIISAKKKILEASFIAKEGHLASAFSVIDLIYVLIKKEFIFEKKKYLNNFILSKGHACLAYYALLNEFNLINDKTFYSFCNYKSILGGHPDRNKSKYFTVSTGSLGHGLPMAVGMGMVDKISKKLNHYYVLMGDQECNEGTVWESLLLINHHNINNITIIIDRNFSREDHLKLGDLKLKLRDFSELIIDIDGHNLKEIEKSIKLKSPPDQPKIIIAKTIKAHGSIIMEDDNSWHHRHPITRKELVELQKSIKK